MHFTPCSLLTPCHGLSPAPPRLPLLSHLSSTTRVPPCPYPFPEQAAPLPAPRHLPSTAQPLLIPWPPIPSPCFQAHLSSTTCTSPTHPPILTPCPSLCSPSPYHPPLLSHLSSTTCTSSRLPYLPNRSDSSASVVV